MLSDEEETFELDDRGNPITSSSAAESIFPTYAELTDPTERAEAYEEVARKYFDSLNSERKSHLTSLKQNTKLIKVQENDIRELQDQIRNLTQRLEQLTEDSEEKKQIIELEGELRIISEQLKNAKALLEQNNRGDGENIEMNLEVKDVIAGIPVFSGDPKKLEGFTNACDIYYSLATEQQKPNVLQIIKAKITGDGLAKAGPFGDELDTWPLLKTRLKSRIKQPISFEYAQQDLSNVFQKRDESIEDYGARVKTKLRNLNEASKKMATTNAEKTILCKANEKQAISKFQQNIRNQTIKVLVSASPCETLDECIAFAMQKELIEKGTNIRSCNFCGMQNHDESSCRKKKNQNNDGKNKSNQKNERKNWNPNNTNKNWRDKPSSSHNTQHNEKINDKDDKQERRA